jgi:hypothetical protein
VTTERDNKIDLSYFRVAKPGEATKKLAASLDEPVNVYLFFPPASDAAEAVQEYFDDLKAAAPQMNVTRLDHALEPVKAKAAAKRRSSSAPKRRKRRRSSVGSTLK